MSNFFKTQVENNDGARFLNIGTIPQIDLWNNIVTVKLYKLDSLSVSELIGEFDSATQIQKDNQTNNFSFNIPLDEGNYEVHIVMTSDIVDVSQFFTRMGY